MNASYDRMERSGMERFVSEVRTSETINISTRMNIRVEIFIVQTFNEVPVYVVSMV